MDGKYANQIADSERLDILWRTRNEPMFLAKTADVGTFDHITPACFGQADHLPKTLNSGIIRHRIFREMNGASIDDDLVSVGMGADDGCHHAYRDFFRGACGNLDHFHVIENEIPGSDLIDVREIFGDGESGCVADGQDAAELFKWH